MGRRRVAKPGKEPTDGGEFEVSHEAPVMRRQNTWSFMECVPVVVMVAHVILCPYTKVEESFGMQATHDLLYTRNMTQFDHLKYPGVVPRSFLGPLGITALSYPVVTLIEFIMDEKCVRMHALYVTRLALGLLHCFGIIQVSRQANRLFGSEAQNIFLLVTSVQFHGLFYASRTLPNSFAMIGFLFALSLFLSAESKAQSAAVGRIHLGLRILTVTCLVFRADLVVFILPLLLSFLVTRRVPFFETCGLGISTGISTILISTAIDSLFWRRLVWPEGEVLFFNTVLNKSSEWGVLPYEWYFKVALPKALLLVYPLVPFAIWKVKELRVLSVPAVLFIALYSFLPHKELRFIFYAFPVLNLVVAIMLGKMWRASDMWKWQWLKQVLIATFCVALLASAGVTSTLTYISSLNYPGGEALSLLHQTKQGGHVHIDTGPSMEGITRFQKNYCGQWTYDKTPHLHVDPRTGKAFDFHVTFDPNNYTTRGYRTILNISAFKGADYPRIKNLDIWPLPIVLNTTAYVVEISSSSSSHFQSIISGQDLSI